jgi:hypothetical protein
VFSKSASRTVALTIFFLLEVVVEVGTAEELVGTSFVAVSSGDRLVLFSTFLSWLDLVGHECEEPLDDVTSRQSRLIRYGSVSLILSAENCGKRADERSRLQLRGRSVVFGWAVVDVFALVSGLEKENGGRLTRSAD